MQHNRDMEVLQMARKTVEQAGSRNPNVIAAQLGIIVMPTAFTVQKGVYKVIKRNRFIFIKEDLEAKMKKIVLLHEIGHDVLHRREANIFGEFDIFAMRNNRFEREANHFAAEIALPDEEILDYIYQGYDVETIAKSMASNVNLVAMKVADLNQQGYAFRPQECRVDFLK